MEVLVDPVAIGLGIVIGMAAAGELAGRFQWGAAPRFAVVALVAAWTSDLFARLGHAVFGLGRPGANAWDVLAALLALGLFAVLYLAYAGKVTIVADSLRGSLQQGMLGAQRYAPPGRNASGYPPPPPPPGYGGFAPRGQAPGYSGYAPAGPATGGPPPVPPGPPASMQGPSAGAPTVMPGSPDSGAAPAAVSTAPTRCRSCGADNPAGAAFCRNCGRPVS